MPTHFDHRFHRFRRLVKIHSPQICVNLCNLWFVRSSQCINLCAANKPPTCKTSRFHISVRLFDLRRPYWGHVRRAWASSRHAFLTKNVVAPPVRRCISTQPDRLRHTLASERRRLAGTLLFIPKPRYWRAAGAPTLTHLHQFLGGRKCHDRLPRTMKSP